MRIGSAVGRALGGWVALGAVLLAVPASAGEPSAAGSGQQWNPWFEFGGLGSDDDNSRALIELWAPLMQSSSTLLFFDGRFQFIEQSTQEGNAHLGLRKMTPSGWNLGAWISGDVRETSVDNTFWQVAGGLEALSAKWDLRINGYLPVTDPKASPELAEVKLKGNSIFLVGSEEVPLHGVNGEIGYLLFGSPETKQGMRYELRVYGGGFWFDDSDAIDEVAGPSTRIEWRIDNLIPEWGGSRLTFDAGYSHDELRGDLYEVGARLRIPLGGTTTYALLSPQSRRMQERIERDDDIVTVQSGPEAVSDALTGVRFDRVAYVGSSVTATSAKAGNNSLLIAKGGNITGPQSLQGNQTLQGGGSTIGVRGAKSGLVLDFTAPGSRPKITNTADSNVLTLLGSNTHVAGLEIVGAGAGSGLFNNNGISIGSSQSNIFVEQNFIRDAGADGIDVQDLNSDISIFNNRIRDTGDQGIQFNSNNSKIAVTGNDVAGAGDQGIQFNSQNTDVVVSDNTVNARRGIQFNSQNSDITVKRNNVVSETQGIQFNSSNSGVTVSRNTVTADNQGIQFNGSNSDITLAGNVVMSDFQGIQFNSNNSDVALTGNSVTSGFQGIQFNGGNSNVSVEANFVAAGLDAMSFNSDNQVSIVGNTIQNPGGSAIRMNADNTMTIADNLFVGTIGDDLLEVTGPGNTLSGTGNINNAVIGDRLCEAGGAGAFAGSVEVNGILLVDNVPPCN